MPPATARPPASQLCCDVPVGCATAGTVDYWRRRDSDVRPRFLAGQILRLHRHGSGIALHTPPHAPPLRPDAARPPGLVGARSRCCSSTTTCSRGGASSPAGSTGKLSDFAFLIVAPGPVRDDHSRGACPAGGRSRSPSVVALYVAADLSRAVSDAVVAAAARVGLHWRLWPDPTDLLALAVLPATVWLLRRPPKPAANSTIARRMGVQRERAGDRAGRARLPGDVAPVTARRTTRSCSTAPTTATDVRITWVLRKADCNTTPDVAGRDAEAERPRRPAHDDADDRRRGRARRHPGGGRRRPSASARRLGRSSSYATARARSNASPRSSRRAGATPVLMLTPRQWNVSGSGGDFISCCDTRRTRNSRCSPKPGHAPQPGRRGPVDHERAAARCASTLTHTGPHEEGPVGDTPIQIAPIDPAAIACARRPSPTAAASRATSTTRWSTRRRRAPPTPTVSRCRR